MRKNTIPAARIHARIRACACPKVTTETSHATAQVWNITENLVKLVSRHRHSIFHSQVFDLFVSLLYSSFPQPARQELVPAVPSNHAQTVHRLALAVEDCEQRTFPSQSSYAICLPK